MKPPTNDQEAAILEAVIRTLDANRVHNAHLPPAQRVSGCLALLMMAAAPTREDRAEAVNAIVCALLEGGAEVQEVVNAIERWRDHRENAGAVKLARFMPKIETGRG